MFTLLISPSHSKNVLTPAMTQRLKVLLIGFLNPLDGPLGRSVIPLLPLLAHANMALDRSVFYHKKFSNISVPHSTLEHLNSSG